MGVGDRFAREAEAQLQSFLLAAQNEANVVPVWNKSNREHLTIGSEPAATRAAADKAVKALGWQAPYHVDADHIRLETVDRFIPHSDFFTIDVADQIGHPAPASAIKTFVARHKELCGRLEVSGLEASFDLSPVDLERIARKYLLAIQGAGKIYRHIAQAKGEGRFIPEISMDETDQAQTPAELLVILAAIADEAIPAQTIAPKFTGRFNKGVDYVGDITGFEIEFAADIAVIGFAVRHYGLPANLKLSIHSGSDKFSIYPAISRVAKRMGAGLHLKTAGTTWLEEVIGLAESGGAGLAIAREIYTGALNHIQELRAPYAAVLDIAPNKLPAAATVNSWGPEQFVAAVRHDPRNPAYNPHLRQLIHIGYKIAANMGMRFLDALEASRATIAKNVTQNLYERHLKPLFLDSSPPTQSAVRFTP